MRLLPWETVDVISDLKKLYLIIHSVQNNYLSLYRLIILPSDFEQIHVNFQSLCFFGYGFKIIIPVKILE